MNITDFPLPLNHTYDLVVLEEGDSDANKAEIGFRVINEEGQY